MSESTKSSLKVYSVDDLPTYRDMHGTREIKLLIDEEVGARNFAVELIVYHSGDEVKMHNHPDAEHAFFVLQGEGFVESDEGRFRIKSGSVVFIPPKTNHRLGNDGDKDLILLEFFAPATEDRKKSLATCYLIPKYKENFDVQLYLEKAKFAETRGVKSLKPTYDQEK